MGRTVAVLCVPPAEDVVGRARLAASKFLACRLAELASVDTVAVATPDPMPWEALHVTVVADPPSGWHFGAQLAQIAAEQGAERLLYFSAGSGVLLTDGELARLVEAAPTEPPYAVLNNFYSTDFGLVAPPDGQVFSSLLRDNPLGFRLWEAGYHCYELPRSAGSQLDLDTPGELQILACHPGLPAELSASLRHVPTGAARALLSSLTETGAELVLVGRAGGMTLRQLEVNAACRVRLISEERGMEAEGRAGAGQARTLLGMYADCVGPQELVDSVCSLGDVVVWDTRVLMAHRGLWPSAGERFAADLLQAEGVSDPFLREFVSACAWSEVPMLLGGHSLVSGGLLLALELAWQGGVDKPKRYLPLVLPQQPQRNEERKADGF
ncbi:MAG: hypothetical protein R6U88_00555 [Candidatus Bipolaricaulota bacterium]